MDTEEGLDAGSAAETGSDPAADDAGSGGVPEAPESPSAPSQADLPEWLESVPPAYRDTLREREAALRAEFDSEKQRLSEASVPEDIADLVRRSEEDPSAFEELMDRLGYEPAEPEASVPDDEIEDEFSHIEDPVVRKALRDQAEREADRAERETEADRERQVSVLKSHVDRGLQPFRDRLKEGEELSDPLIRVFTNTALGHPQPNGLPDVEQAKQLVESIENDAVDRYKASLTKRPPAPATNGSTGVPEPDRSTAKGRRALAEQVAARHYAR